MFYLVHISILFGVRLVERWISRSEIYCDMSNVFVMLKKTPEITFYNLIFSTYIMYNLESFHLTSHDILYNSYIAIF